MDRLMSSIQNFKRSNILSDLPHSTGVHEPSPATVHNLPDTSPQKSHHMNSTSSTTSTTISTAASNVNASEGKVTSEIRDKGYNHAIAGSLSGLMSCAITQPFDTVKTRMIGRHQSRISPVMAALEGKIPGSMFSSSDPQTLYRRIGMLQSMRQVVHHEGWRGLWYGTMPSLVRVGPGSGLYYFFIYQSREWLLKWKGDNSKQLSHLDNVIVGGAARGIGAIFINPITVVKTRFEFASIAGSGDRIASRKHGVGIWNTLVDIHRTEGVARGLFSGLVPTLVRDVPQSALNYMFFMQFKKMLSVLMYGDESAVDIQSSTLLVTSTAGALGGILSTLITVPFDVVRTRLQLKSDYKGMTDGLIRIWTEDGPKGLFRGVVPRVAKRGVASALSWTVYEQVVQLLSAINMLPNQ